MQLMKFIAGLALCLSVAGCATVDTPSKNVAFDPEVPQQALAQVDGSAQPFDPAAPSYDVQKVNVIVPDSLLVSEANSYYPSGDIVWREDPPGNRHEQVAAIFEDAMARGTSNVTGDVPVILDIQVMRFHALTEKTRYTVGGVHSIKFGLSIRSADTGLLLEERRVVQADLLGYGGARAIAAEHQGLTQKVRISAHLAEVIEDELTKPGGFENPRLGFIQVINNRF